MTQATDTAGGTAGDFDLTVTRLLKAPRDLVWRCWTDPEHLKEWFAPKPWTVSEARVEMRPGGLFQIVMCSPEGEEMRGDPGSILHVVEKEMIVLTDALGPGWRPNKEPFFSAIVTLADEAGGTRYTARALHKNEADRETHAKMGFMEGWGTCIDQLGELAARLAR